MKCTERHPQLVESEGESTEKGVTNIQADCDRNE